MSDKFIHELTELFDTLPDDLVLVSRNEVEYKSKRQTLFNGQGLMLDLSITAPIAVGAGVLVAVAGAALAGTNDFDDPAWDPDLGLFTGLAGGGIYSFEMEIEGTSVTADGAGALTLQGLAGGGDRLIASEIVAAPYGTAGANSKWHARFLSIAFLDEAEDFYFGVSRAGAPAASVTGGRIRIIKMV